MGKNTCSVLKVVVKKIFCSGFHWSFLKVAFYVINYLLYIDN